MKNTPIKTNSIKSLRQKAEEKLKNAPLNSYPTNSDADTLKLYHEIEVTKVELEMQNEELIQARLEVQDTIEVYDFAPTGYFTLSDAGLIVNLNLTGAKFLQKERKSIKGCLFESFITIDSKSIFANFLQNIFNNTGKGTCEISLLVFGQSPIYIFLTGTLNKKKKLCLVTAINITERKQNEAILKQERELYQDIVNNQPAGIYRLRVFRPEKWRENVWNNSENPPYRMEFASDRFCEILGITREKFESNPAIISDLIHPEDKNEFTVKNEVANETFIPFKWDGRLVINGKTIWVHLESTPRYISKEEILWTGILYDVTEQIQGVIALKESEIKYRELIENSPDAISIYSDGKIVLVNNECLRLMSAANAEELLGKYVTEFIHPDYRSFAIERMTKVAKDGSIQPLREEKFIRLDGTTVDVEVKSMPIMFQGKKAVQLIVKDITQQKDTENELKENQEDFKDLFDNAPIGYHEIDLEGKIVRMNQTELNMFGFTIEEMLGQYVWKNSATENESRIATLEKLKGLNIPSKPFGRDFCKKDGSTFPVSVQDKLLRNKAGDIIGIRTTIQDISEQIKAQIDLKKSQEDFEDLFDNAPIGYHEIDSEGRIVRMNQTELTMLGYSSEELIGHYMWDIEGNDSRTYHQVHEKLQGLNISLTSFETVLVSKNGLKYSILVQDKILRDKNGSITGIRSTIQDITEQKKADQEIRRIAKHYQALIENAPDGIVLLDDVRNFKYLSPSARKIFGYDSTEKMIQYPNDMTHPDDLGMVLSYLQKIFEDPSFVPTFQHRYINKKGDFVWIESTLTNMLADPNVESIVINFRDITERKNAENDLTKSREEFKDLFDNAPMGYHEIDSEGRIVRMNQTELNMLGFTHEELIGQYIWEIAHNESETHQQVLDKLHGNDIPVASFETILLNKNGSKYAVLIQDKILRDNDGKITGIRSTIQDITEQKKAELDLQLSEEKFRNSFENSIIGKSLTSINGNMTVNKAFSQIIGYSEDELSRLNWTEFTYKEDLEFDIKQHDLILKGEIQSSKWEKRYIHKNGNIVWVDISTILLRDGNGNPMNFITEIYDITERKKAEAELQEKRFMLNKLLFASTEFIDSGSNGIDYGKLTDIMVEISGAKYGSFNLLNEKGSEYTTVGISGLNATFLKVQTILGFKLINKKWNFDPTKQEKIKINAITKFDSIHDLAKNILPKAITTIIEKTFNLKEAYVVKISKSNKIIGDFTLNFIKGKALQNADIIELFANQVGLYIDRENTDNALRVNEEKYRYLFDNNPQPMYIYDLETLVFLEVNNSAIEHYGYSKEEFLKMTLKDIRPPEDIPVFLVDVRDKRKTFKPAGVWRHKKKNGDIIFVDISTVSVISNGRNVRHVMIQDITERKQAEEALKKSVSLLHATIESTADGILVVDRNGKVSTYNQKFIDMWNIQMEILEYKEEVPVLESVLGQVKKQKEFQKKVEYLYSHPNESGNDQIELIDGRVFDRYSLPYRIGNEIVGRTWSFRDITLSKIAAEALRLNEEKFRSITEQIDDFITIYDANGIINYASPASKSLFNYESDEMIGHSFMDFVHEDSLPIAVTAFHAGVDERKKAVDIELKLIRKDGSPFFVELNGTAFTNGDQKGTLIVLHDITNRKLTEEALRMSEDKYRTMIEYSNDLIWSLDKEGNFTFMNEVFTTTTGLILEEWIGKSFVPLLFPEDLPMIRDVYQRSIAGENCNYELRFKKYDKTILTISVNNSPTYSNGDIVGIVCFGRDITVQMSALQSLRESEELYRNLVQRIPDGVYKSTSDGKFIDINPAMVTMLGYDSKEEIMSIDIKSQLYFDEADRDSLVFDKTGVYRLKKKDGTGIWIEDHGWFNADDDQEMMYHEGVLRDITERKNAEDELKEKMNELLRFHNLTIGREMAMIELKKEINGLLVKSGQNEKYKIFQ